MFSTQPLHFKIIAKHNTNFQKKECGLKFDIPKTAK